MVRTQEMQCLLLLSSAAGTMLAAARTTVLGLNEVTETQNLCCADKEMLTEGLSGLITHSKWDFWICKLGLSGFKTLALPLLHPTAS